MIDAASVLSVHQSTREGLFESKRIG